MDVLIPTPVVDADNAGGSVSQLVPGTLGTVMAVSRFTRWMYMRYGHGWTGGAQPLAAGEIWTLWGDSTGPGAGLALDCQYFFDTLTSPGNTSHQNILLQQLAAHYHHVHVHSCRVAVPVVPWCSSYFQTVVTVSPPPAAPGIPIPPAGPRLRSSAVGRSVCTSVRVRLGRPNFLFNPDLCLCIAASPPNHIATLPAALLVLFPEVPPTLSSLQHTA